MPTKPRLHSNGSIYHVVQRGVGPLDLFENDADRTRYLEDLALCADKYHMEVLAWCLMSSHVHLLLRIEFDSLAPCMRDLGARYARWFNTRHNRTGHLFEGRYFSAPIEGDDYFLSAVRYIHANPVRAGMCQRAADYKWSSFRAYVGDGESKTSTRLTLELLGGKEAFASFHELDDGITHLDVRRKLTDEEAQALALQVLGKGSSLEALSKQHRQERDPSLRKLKDLGLPLRQIQRITGIGYSVIQKHDLSNPQG